MNFYNLDERQEEMRQRWAIRSRHPTTKKIICSNVADALVRKLKIALVERGEVLCRICHKNKPVLLRRTGETRPCRKCDYAIRRDIAIWLKEFVDADGNINQKKLKNGNTKQKTLKWARLKAIRALRKRTLCATAA